MAGKIHVVNDIQDPLLWLVKDDPVRKDIYQIERIIGNKEIMVLIEDEKPSAVVCISYQDFIPSSENDLISSNNATIAIFYTIWSYKPGSGKKLLFKAKDYIKENRKNIGRFITLSPLTFTASRFHTNNGAKVLRVNKTSVNYEYK
jgi:hypothetical protein